MGWTVEVIPGPCFLGRKVSRKQGKVGETVKSAVDLTAFYHIGKPEATCHQKLGQVHSQC